MAPLSPPSADEVERPPGWLQADAAGTGRMERGRTGGLQTAEGTTS